MTKVVTAAMFALVALTTVPADARINPPSPFWSKLDRNGTLSAGWVQVLPVLASACKLKLDNRELNAMLVDLSGLEGNTTYTSNLYWHLYLMDRHKAKNTFVSAWKARFGDDQKAACDTAERLWGENGKQFPGVLTREAALDTTSTSSISSNLPPNCR